LWRGAREGGAWLARECLERIGLRGERVEGLRGKKRGRGSHRSAGGRPRGDRVVGRVWRSGRRLRSFCKGVGKVTKWGKGMRACEKVARTGTLDSESSESLPESTGEGKSRNLGENVSFKGERTA